MGKYLLWAVGLFIVYKLFRGYQASTRKAATAQNVVGNQERM